MVQAAAVAAGQQLPVHLVPPSLPLHVTTRNRRPLVRDLEGARKDLAAAGFPAGKGLPEIRVDFMYAGESAEREARLLQRSWKSLGVKLRPVFHADLAAFQKAMRETGCEVAAGYWYADYPDAENFFLMLRRDSSPLIDVSGHAPNHGRWVNEDYDRLYAESCRLAPGPARGALYAKMLRILDRELPMATIAHLREETVLGPRVRRMPNRSRYAFDYSRLALGPAAR